jgi:hypothetical protein
MRSLIAPTVSRAADEAGALTDLAQVLVRNVRQRLDAARPWKELDARPGRRLRRWADATLGVWARTRDYREPLQAVRLPPPIARVEAEHARATLCGGASVECCSLAQRRPARAT